MPQAALAVCAPWSSAPQAFPSCCGTLPPSLAPRPGRTAASWPSRCAHVALPAHTRGPGHAHAPRRRGPAHAHAWPRSTRVAGARVPCRAAPGCAMLPSVPSKGSLQLRPPTDTTRRLPPCDPAAPATVHRSLTPSAAWPGAAVRHPVPATPDAAAGRAAWPVPAFLQAEPHSGCGLTRPAPAWGEPFTCGAPWGAARGSRPSSSQSIHRADCYEGGPTGG